MLGHAPRHRPAAARVGRRVRNRLLPALVAALVSVVVLASGAGAAEPPNPLPWQRTYVADVPMTATDLLNELYATCGQDLERGVRDNGAVGKEKIAVVGDSVQVQARTPSLADTAYYRWIYATHCGEKFRTVLDSGRLADALATSPDVLVFGLGSNNFSDNWQISPATFTAAMTAFQQSMTLSNGVACRVLFNIPERVPSYLDAGTAAQWISYTRQMNDAFANAAATRPGVRVADWRLLTALLPSLLFDDEHLTRAGVNARINLAVATARPCLRPDTPANVDAIAGNGSATVWWDPLPAQEGVTSYRVQVSDGRTITTTQPTLNVGGLPNGTPVSFRVTAVNPKGAGDPSAWTTGVTPTAAGARFHALAPTRVLDTRDGTGGTTGALGPGASVTVDLAGRIPALTGASAVVLNVTAAAPSAEGFVTVWPGGQSRPGTSNLNPRPGTGDTPAAVTTRVGPGGTVSLYNNSGTTHLIADVVGWYDQPGAGTGALYVPLAPTRVLDTRDGTGNKATPFGTATTHTLRLDALPADATAAVVNVTSVNTTANSFITLSPTGAPRPLASNLNPTTGRVRANLTTVAVGTDRSIDVYNNTADTDLVIDLVGYYTADGATTGGAEYFPLTPERTYDTRDGTGGLPGPRTNTVPTTVAFPGHGSLPTSAAATSAVDANLTVVGPTTAGHTTVWPAGPQPLASTLNYGPGEVVPNRDYLTLDPTTGSANLWSVAPQIHYVIDTSGWFGPLKLTAQQLRQRQTGGA